MQQIHNEQKLERIRQTRCVWNVTCPNCGKETHTFVRTGKQRCAWCGEVFFSCAAWQKDGK